MRATIGTLLLLTRVAFSQPSDDLEGERARLAFEACKQQRTALLMEAQQLADLEERGRALQALPRCVPPEPVVRREPPGLTDSTDPVDPADRKDRHFAFFLSGAGALIPFVLASAAINNNAFGEQLVLGAGAAAIFLPSAGHWYAGDVGTYGMGVRVLGGSVATLSLFVLINADDGAGGYELAFWGGVALVGVGSIWDIVTAGDAVDEYNRKRARLTFAPTVLKTAGGFGVGLAGGF